MNEGMPEGYSQPPEWRQTSHSRATQLRGLLKPLKRKFSVDKFLSTLYLLPIYSLNTLLTPIILNW